jgi:hypothetical protein
MCRAASREAKAHSFCGSVIPCAGDAIGADLSCVPRFRTLKAQAFVDWA